MLDFDAGHVFLLIAVLGGLYALRPAVEFITLPFVSETRRLRGPPQESVLWGNSMTHIRNVTTKFTEDWVREYGPLYKVKGFFNVSSFGHNLSPMCIDNVGHSPIELL